MARAKTVKRSQPTDFSFQTATAFEPSSPSSLEEKIRRRAYELFLERGGQNGDAEKDWLDAEAEVLGHSGKRTA